MFFEMRRPKKAFQRADSHIRHIFEPHMIRNKRGDTLNVLIRRLQFLQATSCHGCPYFRMTVEAYSVGNAKGRRLADIMQQHTPGKRTRRLSHALEHKKDVLPNVAFRVKLRRLLYTLTSLHLRQKML